MTDNGLNFNDRRGAVSGWGPTLAWTLVGWMAALLATGDVAASPGAGAEVVVVFNPRVAGSEQVATHYAAVRRVPSNQVVALDLPAGETITRQEYATRLEKPLLDRLLADGWMSRRAGPLKTNAVAAVDQARVRYLVLCYGVPLKIGPDPGLVEPAASRLPEQMRRNEAAVDSELAALPQRLGGGLLTGATPNTAFGCTNGSMLHPTNGVWMVARLDGPTPEVARGLVDLAVLAETNGLWGRAYFDWRGITNANYVLGDEWLRGAAGLVRRAGFETLVDERPDTFPTSLSVHHVAFYGGWYDADVSGPWALPSVEFMPGAFAYHLHSFSAASLRTTNQHWAGPLLARGATATVGYTAEPYLEGTMNLPLFWSRFVQLGFSYGEAAYASQATLSWQTTVVGDPLYQPFAWPPGRPNLGGRLQELHLRLLQNGSRLLEWSHLQVVNLSLANGAPPAEMVNYLREQLAQGPSAVLEEKVGDLLEAQGKMLQAAEAWERALKASPSPRQKISLLLKAALQRTTLAQEKEAVGLYEQLLKECPEFPNRAELITRALALAESAGADNSVTWLREEQKRLAPAP